MSDLHLESNDKSSPEPNEIKLSEVERNKLEAQFSMMPTANNATVIRASTKMKSGGQPELAELVEQLQTQSASVISGDLGRAEAILVSQAHTLDSLFSTLTHKSLANMEAGYPTPMERYMRLALKAQSQCQATLRTLGELKNPKSVTIARQANIAQGHQQVNNGTVETSASRAEAKNEQNELLEDNHGERVDFRAPSEATRGDPAMETVVEIDRAKNG